MAEDLNEITELYQTFADYQLDGNVLGRGSFAVVIGGNGLVKDVKKPNELNKPVERVAVKVILLEKLESETKWNRSKLKKALEREIEIMKMSFVSLHRNIIHLINIKSNAGDLTKFIKNFPVDSSDYKKIPLVRRTNRMGGISQDVIVHLVHQLVSALRALREHNIVHRDLKPQNILLHFNNAFLTSNISCSFDQWFPHIQLKLADFGFARTLVGDEMADTLCGSPLFMAPEILRYEKYNSKADLWSLGTIIYNMITGKAPFRAANHIALLKKIQNTERIRFPDDDLDGDQPKRKSVTELRATVPLFSPRRSVSFGLMMDRKVSPLARASSSNEILEYNGKQNPRSSSGTIFPSSYQDRSIPLNTPTDPRPIPTSSNKLSHRSSGSHSGTSAPHSKFITPQSASPNWNQLNQNSYSSASTVSFGAQLPSSDIGTIYPSTPRRYNAWLEESVAEDPNSPSINSFKSSRRRQSSLAMSSFVPSKVSADSNPDSLDHQGQMEVEDDWVVKGVYSELKLLTRNLLKKNPDERIEFSEVLKMSACDCFVCISFIDNPLHETRTKLSSSTQHPAPPVLLQNPPSTRTKSSNNSPLLKNQSIQPIDDADNFKLTKQESIAFDLEQAMGDLLVGQVNIPADRINMDFSPQPISRTIKEQPNNNNSNVGSLITQQIHHKSSSSHFNISSEQTPMDNYTSKSSFHQPVSPASNLTSLQLTNINGKFWSSPHASTSQSTPRKDHELFFPFEMEETSPLKSSSSKTGSKGKGHVIEDDYFKFSRDDDILELPFAKKPIAKSKPSTSITSDDFRIVDPTGRSSLKSESSSRNGVSPVGTNNNSLGWKRVTKEVSGVVRKLVWLFGDDNAIENNNEPEEPEEVKDGDEYVLL